MPKASEAQPLSAIAIFDEDRDPDELGCPGAVRARRLESFNGPSGPSLLAMVNREDAWMRIEGLAGPVEWN